MNAIRGAGASGLSSIPRRRNRIVRPLLDRTHEELCEILRMRGIVWREDDTNADTRYLRAYVRHKLMPVIERRNPRVTASLASTCDILSDEDAYLTSVASRALRDLTRGEKDGRGVVAGVYGDAPAIDELLVEDDLDPVRGVVEGAKGRDRPGSEPEKPGEVRPGGKGEPAGADAILDLAERDALLVWEADEVVGSVSVVAQEEVLGAVCGKRNLCLPGLLDGEDRRVLGELEGYALALEQIKRGALVEHAQPSLASFPLRLIVSLPSDV